MWSRISGMQLIVILVSHEPAKLFKQRKLKCVECICLVFSIRCNCLFFKHNSQLQLRRKLVIKLKTEFCLKNPTRSSTHIGEYVLLFNCICFLCSVFWCDAEFWGACYHVHILWSSCVWTESAEVLMVEKVHHYDAIGMVNDNLFQLWLVMSSAFFSQQNCSNWY